MTLALNSRYEMSGGDFAALVGVFEGGQTTTIRVDEGWSQSVLRTLRAGSAGVVIVISGYGSYLPCVGTSSSVFDSRPLMCTRSNPARTAAAEHRDLLAIPAREQVRELLAALSVNKSQLAAVLGVSRPTLYEWLSGKEPNAANAQRVSMILRLLAREGVRVSSPLNARFVRERLTEHGPSLLEALSEEDLNEDKITQLVKEARSIENAAESRRRAREDRLRALGYDEPSGEQRKEQLARNVGARDWPTD